MLHQLIVRSRAVRRMAGAMPKEYRALPSCIAKDVQTINPNQQQPS
jgi:hypothetical protein